MSYLLSGIPRCNLGVVCNRISRCNLSVGGREIQRERQREIQRGIQRENKREIQRELQREMPRQRYSKERRRLRPGSVSEGSPGGFREQRYSAVLNGAQHGARVQNDGAQRCSKERTVKSSFIYLPN